MVDLKSKDYGNMRLYAYQTDTEQPDYRYDVRIAVLVDNNIHAIHAALESWYKKHEVMNFFDHLVATNWLPMKLIMGEVTDSALEAELAVWRQMEQDQQVRNPADVIPEQSDRKAD